MSTSDLRHVLRGFGHGNEDALYRLADFNEWQRVAIAERERRATRIIESLDEETLQAIASGELNFQAMCREVAHELARKAA